MERRRRGPVERDWRKEEVARSSHNWPFRVDLCERRIVEEYPRPGGLSAMFSSGNVTVYVSDLDSAIRFYTTQLGLKLTNRFGDRWATVDAGSSYWTTHEVVAGLVIGLRPPRRNTRRRVRREVWVTASKPIAPRRRRGEPAVTRRARDGRDRPLRGGEDAHVLGPGRRPIVRAPVPAGDAGGSGSEPGRLPAKVERRCPRAGTRSSTCRTWTRRFASTPRRWG